MRATITLCVLLVFTAFAQAEAPDNRPPDNRPPDRSRPTPAPTTSVSGATQEQQQQQQIINNNSLFPAGDGGGVDGQAGAQSASGLDGILSPSATGGSSGSNTYRNDNDYFALSVGAPNISGCIVGGSVGGGSGSAGGLLQWGKLNLDCFLTQMGDSERHVDMRARLKCGSSRFRDAVAYEYPKKERQAECIEYTTSIWKAEIDYLVEVATGKLVDQGRPPEILLADASSSDVSELKTAIAVLRSELENEREYIEEKRQELRVEQQQVQQQQQQAEDYVADRVSAGEKRRAESRAYNEQSKAIKLEVRKDEPEG